MLLHQCPIVCGLFCIWDFLEYHLTPYDVDTFGASSITTFPINTISMVNYTPSDTDFKLVTLVVIPRYYRGDYRGLPIVLEVDFASHIQYPLRFPHEALVTCIEKGCYMEVIVVSSHSFIH
jgi:hypothetical protein